MAEAARTVAYHVSDFLKDRHPYNRNQSFETQRERDAGKVFNGFDATGLRLLMSHVLDTSLDATQRAVALRHLLAHSAAPERKIVMLRDNIVGTLASVMTSEHLGESPMVESLVHQVLRSLCVLPQGCIAIMEEGALPVILTSITRQSNGSEDDRRDAQFHASAALSQICSNWAGRGWLLGQVDSTKEFELCSRHSVLTDAQRQQLPDDVISSMNIVMERSGRRDPKLLQQTSQALAALSLSQDGLHKTLIAGTLRVVSSLLASYSKDGAIVQSSPTDADVVTHLSSYVWHACLDPVGLKEALELPALVASLGSLLCTANQGEDGKVLMNLKSAIAGAIGALVLHPDLKKAAITPLDSGATVISACIVLLQSVDTLTMQILDAKKSGAQLPFLTPTFSEMTAVVKNCVQTLRLVAELPAGRELLHNLLPTNDASKEKVRRMTFFSTVWQEEFDVRVY